MPDSRAPRTPKQNQQRGLHQQRQRVFAVHPAPSRVVDEYRRASRARHERHKSTGPAEHHVVYAQHKIVGHRRDDARHVRGVLLDSQESAGIDGPGHECQRKSKVAIATLGSLSARKTPDVVDGHGALVEKSRCHASGNGVWWRIDREDAHRMDRFPR